MAYLKLFHGRKRIGIEKGKPVYEELDDWGADGPIFGPFPYFHTTYGVHIKFGVEFNELTIVDGEYVYYDGMYYGDWSIFDNGVFEKSDSLKSLHQVYDESKAKPPSVGTPAATDAIFREGMYYVGFRDDQEKAGIISGPFEQPPKVRSGHCLYRCVKGVLHRQ